MTVSCISVGPPGLFRMVQRLPVAHATGRGCVGLPSLNRSQQRPCVSAAHNAGQLPAPCGLADFQRYKVVVAGFAEENFASQSK